MPIVGAGQQAQNFAAATFPLPLPEMPQGFAKITIGFESKVGVSRSPYTSSSQVFEWPGEYLTASVELQPMPAPVARAWVALLAALRGQSGTFLLGDTSQISPQGSGAGSPLALNTTPGGSKTFATKGWPLNAVNVLRAGDWLQVGTGLTQRLYMNLFDASADAGGGTILNLFPRVRPEGIANNTPIVLQSPQGVFRLTSNSQKFSVDSAMTYGISFDAMEAI